MREKSACAALNRTPSANGGAVSASDHLSIARRSAQADDHATKTLLFEVPYSLTRHRAQIFRRFFVFCHARLLAFTVLKWKSTAHIGKRQRSNLNRIYPLHRKESRRPLPNSRWRFIRLTPLLL